MKTISNNKNNSVMSTTLREKALLVNLKISQWTARKYDRKITQEVNDAHGTRDAGRFNKLLLDKDMMSKIQRVASKMRIFHYENTLPWTDGGDRILPTANYLSYMKELRDYKKEFEALVDMFVENYEELKLKAKEELNGLYNERDYPSNISSRFGIRYSFTPIPDTEDIRLNLDDVNVEEIRKEIESAVTDRHEEAIKDMFVRAKKAIDHMAETLKDKDKKFKNSLVGNIQKMIELFPALNYTNNPKIGRLIGEMKTLLAEPDNLRSDKKVREHYAKRAEQLSRSFF